MIIAVIITLIIINLSKRARPSVAEWWFRKLQLVSSAALSFAHGGNDAQKVMGIIFVAMVAGASLQSGDNMTEWLPLTSFSAIALGTMRGGGKIVRSEERRVGIVSVS